MRRWMVESSLALGWAVVSQGSGLWAQEPAPVGPRPEVVTLRYVTVKNQDQFKFVAPDGKSYTKTAGDMNFEAPTPESLQPGFSSRQRTYCAEPLVPIYSGRLYDFQIDKPDEPRWFGLQEAPESVVQAERRMSFIRELYGRYYAETVERGEVSSAAFQVALWELIHEPTLPEGPMPFHLYTGLFRADYPSEAESPEFVRLAQSYLQNLTGDETPFRESPLLKETRIVRLTGLPSVVDGIVPQAQLALRSTNLPETEEDSLSGGGGAMGPLNPLNTLGGGGGPGGGGLGRIGAGLAGGSPPLLGGGGGVGGAPFFGGGFGGNSANQSTPPDSNNGGGGSPQLPGDNGTISLPPAIRPPENIPSNPSPNNPDTIPPILPTPPDRTPTPTPDPNNPIIPAPPAVWLLVLGGGLLLRWRRTQGTAPSSTPSN